jgi:crotonobetainyl-CoA:carnitine CoA-transferase CaiB-like acyl-CoA transferase
VGVGILSALEYRRRTGRGQHLDVSQCECGIQNIAPVIMDYIANGNSAVRAGNSYPLAAPHSVYPCLGDDRWCAITVFDDAQWGAFCRVIDEEWTADPKFASLLSRKQNEAELDAHVSEWTMRRMAEDVEASLQVVGVPCHLVATIKDAYDDPHMRHRGFLRKLNHSVMDEHTYYTHGFKMSKVEGDWRTGPLLGEHNEYVFKEILSMTDDEIADALVEGVLVSSGNITPFR